MLVDGHPRESQKEEGKKFMIWEYGEKVLGLTRSLTGDCEVPEILY